MTRPILRARDAALPDVERAIDPTAIAVASTGGEGCEGIVFLRLRDGHSMSVTGVTYDRVLRAMEGRVE